MWWEKQLNIGEEKNIQLIYKSFSKEGKLKNSVSGLSGEGT